MGNTFLDKKDAVQELKKEFLNSCQVIQSLFIFYMRLKQIKSNDANFPI